MRITIIVRTRSKQEILTAMPIRLQIMITIITTLLVMIMLIILTIVINDSSMIRILISDYQKAF